MSDFWNERFATKEYVYGTAPNRFFSQQLEQLSPGKLLLPGEGEGRNAVFAARMGWQVTAFDSSIEGKKKAEQLAARQQVELNYQIDSYDSIDLEAATFDCLALIYTHMPPGSRQAYHQKLSDYLKKDGTLILEGFSKVQIHNNTGGPQNVAMLFSKEELQTDFTGFSSLKISEAEVELDEGPFHKGKASVIRLVAIK